MLDPDRCDAIHRSLLGRGIRHSGASRFRRVPGECPRHEESARAQKRRTGESVADETAHLWIVAKFVSTDAGDSHDADLLATTERSSAQCGPIQRMQKALTQMNLQLANVLSDVS